MKIEVLTPKSESQVLFKFKLPFNTVFVIQNGKIIVSKYYIDPEELLKEEMKNKNQTQENFPTPKFLGKINSQTQ
jgi:uncharacterized lipoprotein YbaY